MIEVRISCRKHPRYMGYMKPRAKWSPYYNSNCPGCEMVYDVRQGTATRPIRCPWVRIKILRSAPK